MIFRKEIYAFEVDLWSIGCLFAEMALGEALFSGESEVEQLFKIFKFVGAPSEDLFTKYKVPNDAKIKLPDWNRVYFGYASYDSNSEEFQQLVNAYMAGREDSLYRLMELKDIIGLEGLDLLWKLLELDPQYRINTIDAMNHPFFKDIQTDMEVDTFEEFDQNLVTEDSHDIVKFAKLLRK